MNSDIDFLTDLSIQADVFFTGNLCGVQHLDEEDDAGTSYLHLLKRGEMRLVTDDGLSLVLNKPTIILLPRAAKQKIITEPGATLDIVCAKFSFQALGRERLMSVLPKILCFNVEQQETLVSTAHWIFDEGFSERYGKQALLNSLCKTLVVLLFRELVDQDLLPHQTLAGMSQDGIGRVLSQLHEAPSNTWSLEAMASIAAMSRAKFSALFRDIVGLTPNDYLARLRIQLAKECLQRGMHVNAVAQEVGYEHGSALARVFRKRLGMSPSEWLSRADALKSSSKYYSIR